MDKIKQFISRISYDMSGFFSDLTLSDLEKKISLGVAGFFAFCLLVWLICFMFFFETLQTVFGILTIIGLVAVVGWCVGLLVYKKKKW